MLFLVQTTFHPPELTDAERDELIRREVAASEALQSRGVIIQLLRVVGTRRAVGLWRADDAEHAAALVASLPCAAFMDVEITEVIAHPNSVRGIAVDSREVSCDQEPVVDSG